MLWKGEISWKIFFFLFSPSSTWMNEFSLSKQMNFQQCCEQRRRRRRKSQPLINLWSEKVILWLQKKKLLRKKISEIKFYFKKNTTKMKTHKMDEWKSGKKFLIEYHQEEKVERFSFHIKKNIKTNKENEGKFSHYFSNSTIQKTTQMRGKNSQLVVKLFISIRSSQEKFRIYLKCAWWRKWESWREIYHLTRPFDCLSRFNLVIYKFFLHIFCFSLLSSRYSHQWETRISPWRTWTSCKRKRNETRHFQ